MQHDASGNLKKKIKKTDGLFPWKYNELKNEISIQFKSRESIEEETRKSKRIDLLDQKRKT